LDILGAKISINRHSFGWINFRIKRRTKQKHYTWKTSKPLKFYMSPKVLPTSFIDYSLYARKIARYASSRDPMTNKFYINTDFADGLNHWVKTKGDLTKLMAVINKEPENPLWWKVLATNYHTILKNNHAAGTSMGEQLGLGSRKYKEILEQQCNSDPNFLMSLTFRKPGIIDRASFKNNGTDPLNSTPGDSENTMSGALIAVINRHKYFKESNARLGTMGQPFLQENPGTDTITTIYYDIEKDQCSYIKTNLISSNKPYTTDSLKSIHEV
jgi:hypothetical protein